MFTWLLDTIMERRATNWDGIEMVGSWPCGSSSYRNICKRVSE